MAQSKETSPRCLKDINAKTLPLRRDAALPYLSDKPGKTCYIIVNEMLFTRGGRETQVVGN